MKDVIQSRKKSLTSRGSALWYLGVLPRRFRDKRLGLLKGYWDYFKLQRETRRVLTDRVLLEGYVTVVITSAGRKAYLEQTIDSLRKWLEYDASKLCWYLIDDFPDSPETRAYIEGLSGFDLKILNPTNMGLGYSLNRIYREIQTEFVLHCEDDWLFLQKIPLAEMICLMQDHPELRQLALFGDTGGNQRNRKLKSVGKIGLDSSKYGFPPHLARMRLFIENQPFPLYYTELEYTLKLERSGWRVSGIYGYPDDKFVRHLGTVRKVKNV